MNYGLQLGRRFRSLKLWMVIRMYGVRGLQEVLRRHIELAQEFAGWIRESKNFELMAPHPLSTVCFRAKPAGVSDLNAFNEALMNSVNETGEMYISHTKLHDKITLRLAIGNMKTERVHVARAWQLLEQHFAAIKDSRSNH
jgi:aromatic-L-amino-acid decarboxylase